MIKIAACLFFLLTGLTSFGISIDSLAFSISGEVDTIPFAKYDISYMDGENRIEDSVVLDSNSKFNYTGYISEPTRFFLTVKNEYDLPIIGDYAVYSFWIEPGGKIVFYGDKFKIDSYNGADYKLKNSPTDDIANLYVEELTEIYRNASEKDRTAAKMHFDKEFINRHIGSYYGLYVLSRLLRSAPKESPYVDSVARLINDELKNTYLYHTIRLKLKFDVGREFPDFTLPDTSSNVIRLSDQLKSGQFILIDFWASWCVPCRKEHPYLKEAYTRFNPYGFEIISISLDDSPEAWMEAIRQDELEWLNLSDLQGIKQGISKEFAISSIPTNFLINSEGTILAKNLRKDALIRELERRLRPNEKDKKAGN